MQLQRSPAETAAKAPVLWHKRVGGCSVAAQCDECSVVWHVAVITYLRATKFVNCAEKYFGSLN